MYLDDILKYNRVCVASTYGEEHITDKLLKYVSNYMDNHTIIKEEDDCDVSTFIKDNIVCFKPLVNFIKKDQRIPYSDNFVIYKTFLYQSISNNFAYQIQNHLLRDSDLVFYIFNNQVAVVKDMYNYFQNRDREKLYNEITIGDRIYKLNKIKKRNE